MYFPVPVLTPAFAGLLLLSSAGAQSRHDLLPSGPPTLEGEASRYVEGLGTTGRSQVLLEANLLAALRGRALTGVAFRRDGFTERAWRGGAVDLVVQLGAAARPVTAPARDFTANLPSPVEVFRGRVTMPATTPTTAPVDWTAQDVVQIDFDLPFRYQGGDLVLDLRGTPVRGEAFGWPVDAVADDLEGRVGRLGQACGRFRHADGSRAFVAPRELVPGMEAAFDLSAAPGASATLLLAPAPRSRGLDLAALGAPGCTLHVDPVVVLPTTVSAPWADPAFGGVARVGVPLPGESRLVGSTFAAQWLDWDAAGPTASEALDCRLAGRLPILGMALCSQRSGGPVRVTTHVAPRLRFTSRP